jgi:hypothetical protein
MAEASAPARCPEGHDDTVKLLSTVSVGGRASTAAPQPGGGGGREARGRDKQSGGCCGGACGCR